MSAPMEKGSEKKKKAGALTERLQKRFKWYETHKKQLKADNKDEGGKLLCASQTQVEPKSKNVNIESLSQKLNVTENKPKKKSIEKTAENSKTISTESSKTEITAVDKKSPEQQTSPKESKKKSKKKKYYVLFLGNLAFNTTEEEIREHFIRCGVIEDVRLLTNKETGKPRGCAYIQFESVKGHKNALMLHKSKLKGREINVEFTSPGRKNFKRNSRLEFKNKSLAKFKLSRDHVLPQNKPRMNKYHK